MVLVDRFILRVLGCNIYKMSTEQNKKLLGENITKISKKAPPKLQRSIHLEVKYISIKIKLSDPIEELAEAPAYVTLKVHKKQLFFFYIQIHHGA